MEAVKKQFVSEFYLEIVKIPLLMPNAVVGENCLLVPCITEHNPLGRISANLVHPFT